jgi:Cys-tRNA(Pro)/Cys-tRNA(Cys) deacylase
MFKTLIAQADGRLVAALVPVGSELDLKALAAAVGSRRATLAEPTAAERATGYVVGGISPLGGRRRLATFIDSTALDHATILVSAGKRGLQLVLGPRDLVRLTDATVVVLGRA